MQRPRRFHMLSCQLMLNRTSPTLIGGMNATQENELGSLLFTVSSFGLAPNSENLINNLLTESRALFLIIASTVLVYANSLNGAFVFDDTKQIAGNPELHTWSNIFHAF